MHLRSPSRPASTPASAPTPTPPISIPPSPTTPVPAARSTSSAPRRFAPSAPSLSAPVHSPNPTFTRASFSTPSAPLPPPHLLSSSAPRQPTPSTPLPLSTSAGPTRRTPFAPTRPPRPTSALHPVLPSSSPSPPSSNPHNIPTTTTPPHPLPPTSPTTPPAARSLPASLPSLSPSYPATLFGGLSADDEHVTVWHPASGKTVAGNAAPYRRNLAAWLALHRGWEEKADELKSSKRRLAARRARSAADSFASLCAYPVAQRIASDAALRLAKVPDDLQQGLCSEDAVSQWTSDDFVRLQEALFTMGQALHPNVDGAVSDVQWATVRTTVGTARHEATMLYCAQHMLVRGIRKSRAEMTSGLPWVGATTTTAGGNSNGGNSNGQNNTSGDGGITGNTPTDCNGMWSFSPAASCDGVTDIGLMLTSTAGSTPGSVGADDGASVLERSFRAPREPRVTVWEPATGRTISGNAAPCKRNLGTWMKDHPGWFPKEEAQLSSSRRQRNRRGVAIATPGRKGNMRNGGDVRASSLPGGLTRDGGNTRSGGINIGTGGRDVGGTGAEPESPHFKDALEGLLGLSRCTLGGSYTEGMEVGRGGGGLMGKGHGEDAEDADEDMMEEDTSDMEDADEEQEQEEEEVVRNVGGKTRTGKNGMVSSSVSGSSAGDYGEASDMEM